jgi:RNA polymerase sigma-70 factor (ECF subfamily)
MRLTRRRDLADDIVQETYARVLANLENLTPDGRFEGYLARIATNLVLEQWRRQRPTVEAGDTFPSPEAAEPWRTVADAEEDRRRLAAIWAAAATLEPRSRAAMLLYYAQGEPYEEIARILEVPVGTLKTWLYRARREVRRGAEVLLRGQPAMERNQTGELP